MMKPKFGYRWVAAALASAAWATVAAAGDATVPGVPVAQSGPTDNASARRVFRDKETGQLRAPTNDELKAMLEEEKAARKARGEPEPTARATPLLVRQFPSGMRSAVLGPEFLVTIKAEKGPDGKVVVSHTRAEHEHPSVQPQRPTE